ncbi:hypothetical protein [Candidatus Laterigemmans baculatus]|uniref:hypothetical protein n=1 Tax=Candidatus Laterigemmans baculatus TaxID=2770505 RepID=UPI0013DAF25C|nr:hypothetical protein [Candidatus Laterigemmans baculatus]
MTTTTTDPFAELASLADDPAEMLEALIQIYRRQRMPHELFEALKMRMRVRLGLPLLSEGNEKRHPEDIERQLEHGLLDACRETGLMLLAAGRIREGWMYLRPTGDTEKAAEMIRRIDVSDENADEIIQVTLHEGVDVGYGFRLVLDRMGTCNSITTYEQVVASASHRDQQTAAAMLLDHLYAELLAAVRADIERREGTPPSETTLDALVANRRELFENRAYHLDTTHLASTVRIARVLEKESQLQRAWELVQYGRRLDPQYQYPSDEPFHDFYPAHALFYGALLGRGVNEAVSYFRQKALEAKPMEQGTGAIETYIDLLSRLGRAEEALATAVKMIPADVPAPRVAPLLLDLAAQAKNSRPVQEFARRRGDLLIYAAALGTRVD